MNAADVIRGALERLGPNGEGWASNSASAGDKLCMGLTVSRTGREHREANNAAKRLICEEIGIEPSEVCFCLRVGVWNDDPHTGWEDVHLVLKRALHRAEAEGL